MSRRLVNLLLLASVVALVTTGLIPWLLPESLVLPLYAAHRVAGVALVLALVWKYGIASRSLRRRLRLPRPDRTVVAGALATLALLVTLALGLAWSTGLVSFDRPWPYSPLNVHVFLGIALIPLLVWHVAQRLEARPAVGRLLTRRSALRLLVLGAAALVVNVITDRIAEARRPTGSKHAGSFTGNAFPLTIWQFDTVPPLDAATWSLEVRGRVARPGRLSYAELLALGRREATAILDCTGGWWSEQVWSGTAVRDLLRARGLDGAATAVEVVSVTGHRWGFTVAELEGALLATHVGGQVLSAGHGYPARLVVPGRRGFQWVKWVDRLEVA